MLSGSVEESSISETVTQQHDFSLVTAGAMCAYSEEATNYRWLQTVLLKNDELNLNLNWSWVALI